MKKGWIWGLLLLMLTGCGSQETFETVADDIVLSVMASPKTVSVSLPQEAAIPVLESDTRQIYICEDYEIALENVPSGDLQSTVRQLCGYDKDALTVMQTRQDGSDRYDFVWVSAGEEGQRLGRAAILDDGNYHYCLSVLRDADGQANDQPQWEAVFSSFSLTEGFIRTD